LRKNKKYGLCRFEAGQAFYGEEYEIVSDPFIENQEIVVEAKTKKDPAVRMVRLPSTVLPSVRGRRSQSAA
jgi:hypothetical protein